MQEVMERPLKVKRAGSVNGSNGVCLDGKHMLSKLFPGTLGRMLGDGETMLHEECPFCRDEDSGQISH